MKTRFLLMIAAVNVAVFIAADTAAGRWAAAIGVVVTLTAAAIRTATARRDAQ
jgi:hypothetical protein